MKLENIQQYIPKNTTTKWHGNTAVFEVSHAEIVEVAQALYKNLPLKLITAADERQESGVFKIFYVFGVPKENAFVVPFIQLKNTKEFPSLTPTIHEAWGYERKIRTFFGLTPVGHPDSRPLILHENWPSDEFPLRKDFHWGKRPEKAKGLYAFEKVEGEGVYEIPVGPIHAGIIEPGHFRFSVAGEEILLLEARLGFVHKGTEKLFEVLSLPQKVQLSEKVSGDSSFSHSLAFCQAVESLNDIPIPKRARLLRVVFAELERIANHIGDIGFIMLDTGFNFGGTNGSRLKEMVMQINEYLTDSRFLRGVNAIGGAAKDISKEQQRETLKRLETIIKDFSAVVDIARDNASLLNRLEGTGILTGQVAVAHGIVGVAGKALGIEKDARVDYPYAAYDELQLNEIAKEQKGDVYARFNVRIKEVYASHELIKNALEHLPEGELCARSKTLSLKKNALGISIVEGWRGDIVYFITTDSEGNISRVAPRDPSFVNWIAVGLAGPGNIVPDFPLINKSFNLSYSGNDL